MAQKTYSQIQDEANRMFGKGASQQKFEWRRAQQAEAGLEQETKKRGGVAGAYDRNKALVQAAIPLIAGALIPGSSVLAGALSGGLARGLDREGKRGIGLDLGQAAKGAFSGAVMGKFGGAARTGIQGMMAGGGAPLKPLPPPGAGSTVLGGQPPGISSSLRAMPEMGRSATTVGERVAQAVMPPSSAAPIPAVGPSFGQRLGAGAMEMGRSAMGAAGRAGRALMERPEIVGQALTAGAAARTGAANRELERERMAQQESQFQRTYGQSEEERKREIDRQRRIAELLAPVFQRVAGGQG